MSTFKNNEVEDLLKAVKEGIGRESSSIECKLCKSELSKDLWETISAFSNEGGGLALLGYEKRIAAPYGGISFARICK